MATNEQTVKLQSQEGDIFEVNIALLNQSEVLKEFAKPNNEDPIPLPNIKSAVLEKIIGYMEHHKTDWLKSEEDADDNRERDVASLSDWDQAFLNIDIGILFELINAANYLNIKYLLDVACKKAADVIKVKSPETIRRTLNIKNEFTPAEQEQIQKEKEWCSET